MVDFIIILLVIAIALFLFIKIGLKMSYSGTFVVMAFLSILFTVLAPIIGQVGIIVWLIAIPGFFVFSILAVIARVIEDKVGNKNTQY